MWKKLTRGRHRPRVIEWLLRSEVNREEDDTFRERREDDRSVTDGTSSARIASGCFRGLCPDETHADRRSETGETDVNTASDASSSGGSECCQDANVFRCFGFSRLPPLTWMVRQPKLFC